MLKWISTRDMSREDWLKARKQGIGGSDAAAIMEATKFASPLSVYLDKLDLVPEKPMTEAMQQGIDCEEVVAQRFARETGLKITKCYRMFRSEAHPFMQANIDRCVLGDGFIGLECKTTSHQLPGRRHPAQLLLAVPALHGRHRRALLVSGRHGLFHRLLHLPHRAQ